MDRQPATVDGHQEFGCHENPCRSFLLSQESTLDCNSAPESKGLFLTELVKVAKECCVQRQLTSEERELFGLPAA